MSQIDHDSAQLQHSEGSQTQSHPLQASAFDENDGPSSNNTQMPPSFQPKAMQLQQDQSVAANRDYGRIEQISERENVVPGEKVIYKFKELGQNLWPGDTTFRYQWKAYNDPESAKKLNYPREVLLNSQSYKVTAKAGIPGNHRIECVLYVKVNGKERVVDTQNYFQKVVSKEEREKVYYDRLIDMIGSIPPTAANQNGNLTVRFKLDPKTGKPVFDKYEEVEPKEGETIPFKYSILLEGRKTTMRTISELDEPDRAHPLVAAGLKKLNQDNKRFKGTFPEKYYEEFGRYLTEVSILLNDGDIGKAVTETWDTLDNRDWIHGSGIYHMYENTARENDDSGHDKLMHFSASCYWQYKSGGTLSEVMQWGKEIINDEIPSWFTDDKGFDPKDMEANRRGERYGEELEKRNSDR